MERLKQAYDTIKEELKETLNEDNENISDEKEKEIRKDIENMLRPGETFLSHDDIMDIANRNDVQPEKVAILTSSVAQDRMKEMEGEKKDTMDFIVKDIIKDIREEKGDENYIPSFREFIKKIEKEYPGYDNELFIDLGMDYDEIEKEYKKRTEDPDQISLFENDKDGDDIYLSVDGEEPISFKEFYKINTGEGVLPPSKEEFERIKNLEVGESIQFSPHEPEIKRVK